MSLIEKSGVSKREEKVVKRRTEGKEERERRREEIPYQMPLHSFVCAGARSAHAYITYEHV